MKITEKDISLRFEKGASNPDVYHYWAMVNKSLITFEQKANIHTFRKLFGENAGKLYEHFWNDCNCKFQKFLTYLTQEQKNELIINAHENQSFLYINL